MPSHVEHYGFIANRAGSALVSKFGSVDWLCIPRFDSPACMAALLGREAEHGSWSIEPQAPVQRIERRYRPGTLVLETDFACDGGSIRVVDFMAAGHDSLVRIVEGLGGEVPVYTSLSVRFGYGAYKPLITRRHGGIGMTVAPDSLELRTSAELTFDEKDVRGAFPVHKGQTVAFELAWHASHEEAPPPLDVRAALTRVERESREWIARSTFHGPYEDAVNASLLVLKGMTYAASGGIVAAPTAGLPEEIGGVRNWDYRYCWLRDATLTLKGLMAAGYVEEAEAWRDWLLAATAGSPDDLQIMYGISGERRLTEFEATWLPGYEESRPVRIGNAASEQFQLDVYGEVVQALYEARRLGLRETATSRIPARKLFEFIEGAWQRPDDGIWEVRHGRRHFVHSKLMAWVAADRFVKTISEFTPPDDPARASLPRCRALADHIRRDILEHGFDPRQNSFTQAYGSPALDASTLLVPVLGFLPASDPRVQGTIAAVERNLLRDGLVLRYRQEDTQDGLTGSEGAFLACSFWLVDAYALSGRRKEAVALFERLLSLRNDLGLLAEEYEPRSGRLLGNFPQAFSHLALIHSASILAWTDAAVRVGGNGRAKAPPPAPLA
jgi:GH15 family glucan-1,4-alpha-glucosidase